jgi:hypothetical protein
MSFDFSFDILDPNRIVLGLTYSRGLMTRVEKDLETDEDLGEADVTTAYMFTIGLFFFSFTIISYSFE